MTQSVYPFDPDGPSTALSSLTMQRKCFDWSLPVHTGIHSLFIVAGMCIMAPSALTNVQSLPCQVYFSCSVLIFHSLALGTTLFSCCILHNASVASVRFSRFWSLCWCSLGVVQPFMPWICIPFVGNDKFQADLPQSIEVMWGFQLLTIATTLQMHFLPFRWRSVTAFLSALSFTGAACVDGGVGSSTTLVTKPVITWLLVFLLHFTASHEVFSCTSTARGIEHVSSEKEPSTDALLIGIKDVLTAMSGDICELDPSFNFLPDGCFVVVVPNALPMNSKHVDHHNDLLPEHLRTIVLERMQEVIRTGIPCFLESSNSVQSIQLVIGLAPTEEAMVPYLARFDRGSKPVCMDAGTQAPCTAQNSDKEPSFCLISGDSRDDWNFAGAPLLLSSCSMESGCLEPSPVAERSPFTRHFRDQFNAASQTSEVLKHDAATLTSISWDVLGFVCRNCARPPAMPRINTDGLTQCGRKRSVSRTTGRGTPPRILLEGSSSAEKAAGSVDSSASIDTSVTADALSEELAWSTLLSNAETLAKVLNTSNSPSSTSLDGHWFVEMEPSNTSQWEDEFILWGKCALLASGSTCEVQPWHNFYVLDGGLLSLEGDKLCRYDEQGQKLRFCRKPLE